MYYKKKKRNENYNLGMLPVMSATPYIFSGMKVGARGMSAAAMSGQPMSAARIGTGGLMVGSVVGQSARVISGLFNMGVKPTYKRFVKKTKRY